MYLFSAPAAAATAEPDLSQFLSEEAGVDSDQLLAQMLQHEFDKEHDAMLHSDESKVNANRTGMQCMVTSKIWYLVHDCVRFQENIIFMPVILDILDDSQTLY